MKKFDRRAMNIFGAPDDFRSIVTRRLVALDYVLDGDGNVVQDTVSITAADSGAGTLGPEYGVLAGQPATAANLAAGSIPAPASSAPPASSSTAVGSSTSWLSGLGAIGSAAASIIKAVTPGATAINPATGKPYGAVNPTTGLPYPALAATGSSSLVLILLVCVVAWVVLRK